MEGIATEVFREMGCSNEPVPVHCKHYGRGMASIWNSQEYGLCVEVRFHNGITALYRDNRRQFAILQDGQFVDFYEEKAYLTLVDKKHR